MATAVVAVALLSLPFARLHLADHLLPQVWRQSAQDRLIYLGKRDLAGPGSRKPRDREEMGKRTRRRWSDTSGIRRNPFGRQTSTLTLCPLSPSHNRNHHICTWHLPNTSTPTPKQIRGNVFMGKTNQNEGGHHALPLTACAAPATPG